MQWSFKKAVQVVYRSERSCLFFLRKVERKVGWFRMVEKACPARDEGQLKRLTS
jgi:hypothetical protein